MAADPLLDFLDKCLTPFHFAAYAASLLTDRGYVELSEASEWPSIPSKGFIVRDRRTLLAFNLGSARDSAVLVCTHSDSPSLHLKPRFAASSAGLQTLRVCLYGGPLIGSWRNRDLRVAGVVYHREDGRIKSSLFDSEKAIAFLPAPIKPDQRYDLDTDFLPIFALEGGISFDKYVANKLGIDVESITDWDLCLLDAQPPAIVGAKHEFVTSRKIDDMASTFSALNAFLNSSPGSTINILVVFDHEEEGSMTRHGAHGNLIPSFLTRLLGDDFHRVAANSIIVSADNGHALHPNYDAKHDHGMPAGLGQGVVLKHRLACEYATTLTSAFPLARAAEHCGVSLSPSLALQSVSGGSTIGPALSIWSGISTVDVGLPQLAMHSAREFMALADVDSLTKLLVDLYEHFPDYQLP